MSGYHGNEIGGPVVALDAMTRLTEGYGTDATISVIRSEASGTHGSGHHEETDLVSFLHDHGLVGHGG